MRTLFTVKHRLNNTANDSERKKAVTVEDTVNVVEGIDLSDQLYVDVNDNLAQAYLKNEIRESNLINHFLLLFLHILERLSGHFHLIQKCFLFLQPNTILFNVTFPFTVGEVNVRESGVFLLPSPSPTSIVSTSSSAPDSLFIVTPLSSFICTCK
ncbi:hypothetical protein ALC56_11770 [Trachymyrmex septentrionalis]|uniref:Uncharacterized protein n=1 Tax=Trachymyrmex septentrionalis TaxID=34720 RepID=A0A195F0R6_9HYME|nr:hypothetical protein ALC56_11770 [Trachymyrmex septentrionalis]